MYNTHSDFERGNYGENCAYYNRIFTVIGPKIPSSLASFKSRIVLPFWYLSGGGGGGGNWSTVFRDGAASV